MKRFVIVRDIPGVGELPLSDLRAVAKKSNDALVQLAPKVQWQESFVAGNQTFCIYLAEDASDIEEHSRLSGIPFTSITEVRRVIDPTAAHLKR